MNRRKLCSLTSLPLHNSILTAVRLYDDHQTSAIIKIHGANGKTGCYSHDTGHCISCLTCASVDQAEEYDYPWNDTLEAWRSTLLWLKTITKWLHDSGSQDTLTLVRQLTWSECHWKCLDCTEEKGGRQKPYNSRWSSEKKSTKHGSPI